MPSAGAADRFRLLAEALAEPPLPALFGVSAVGWVGVLAAGHAGMGHGAAGHGGPGVLAVGAGWFAMLAAMMAPLLADPLRLLWHRSLRPRRVRAVAAFVAGYLAVWMAVGAVLLAVAAWLRPLPGWTAPLLGLAAVLAWQASPWKQACLNRCHQAPRLAAFGWAADRDALRYGLTKGGWCVGSCWALMLLPLLAGPAGLAVMLVVTAVMLAERWRPARAPAWRLPVGSLR